ncbi:L-Ala-D/L-Glu epimerase [archaeon HR01]|nr:L-Ala-D/L-Glu epimerase [archaeon HR01]
MKIRDLRFTPVSVPYREPEHWAWGVREGVTALLIEVDADDGLTGLGESVPFVDLGYAVETLKVFKSLLVGEDPSNIEKIYHKLGALGYQHVVDLVFAGVETALWDLVAKELDKPLYRILGGAVREDIEFAPWLWIRRPEEMVKEAERFAEEGFNTFYIKVALNPKDDIERVKVLREGLGDDIRIRVDANRGWTPGEAVRMINKLEKYDLEFVEEPTAAYGLKMVKQSVRTPIASGDSASTPHEILQLVMERSIDIFSHIDPDLQGGLLNSKKACAICEMAGLPVVAHTGVDLGLGVAAILHLVASTPNFLYPNQTLYMRLEDDVIKEPFVFERGAIKVPESPGLGVELDPRKVERYHNVFRERGAFPAYGIRPPAKIERILPPRLWL